MMRTSTSPAAAPTASTVPYLQRAQQFYLRGQAATPDLVEKQRATGSFDELPMWRSVAPVKAPSSWPNRIDSTRLSGMAPQLTRDEGFDLRSLEP